MYLVGRIHTDEDRTEGRNFADGIYSTLKSSGDNGLILSSATGEKEKLKGLLSRISMRMGSLIAYQIGDVETKRVERNGFIIVSYVVKVRVKYEKGDSDEVLGLVKRGGDKILVDGYNVYSDLLL